MEDKSEQQSINSPFGGHGGYLHLTEDGSHTLFVPEIDECYHSTKGAIQESRHIFIKAGLKQCEKTEINVLEIGFGTGLNAFLTMLALHPRSAELTSKPKEGVNEEKSKFFLNKIVNYVSIELFPIELSKALQLNYPEILGESFRELFENIHKAPWNEKVQITENFTLTKIQADFTNINFTEKFDVIYFDAFSPEKQPEMWSEEMFKKLYLCASENAILTTYCSKGAVRRAMQAAGFTVERLQGPPGKREILRARKISL